jgi:hypothetical protein
MEIATAYPEPVTGSGHCLTQRADVLLVHLRVCTVKLAGSRETIGLGVVHILTTQGVPFHEGV